MTDVEFAEWMRSLPREVPEAEVNRLEHLHDIERGDWLPDTHHTPGEAAH